jgi:hypothetical protein
MALDLGTTTGWAMHTGDGNIVSGTHGFKPGRFEGGGMRYLRFRDWLAELLATSGSISAVYFEEVRRQAGVDASHATGEGNADKAPMVAAIEALGFHPADDNEADALALLCWALAVPTAAAATCTDR